MRRSPGVLVGVVLLAAFTFGASSCFFGGSTRGDAAELTTLANKVETATYAATYRFAFTRQFAPGITTRMEITQSPPVTVRKKDTTTKGSDGKPITLTVWYVHNAKGDFACNTYEGVGNRCEKTVLARSSFGTASLDVFFDTPRTKDAFASVRKAPTPERIKGQQATCFEAVPLVPTPEAASPQATDERFRYELCYAEDGILMRGKRITLDDSGAAANAESFVEALSVSRVVEPSELRLPGPIVEPGDLP